MVFKLLPFPTQSDSFCDINEKLTNDDVQKVDQLLLFKQIFIQSVQKPDLVS